MDTPASLRAQQHSGPGRVPDAAAIVAAPSLRETSGVDLDDFAT